MTYDFQNIEKKWQQYWKENNTYKTNTDTSKPKFYSLDMFPYPSGSGLHVGHPLGYIASDILSRFKKLKGFNVLHPMGFDSFGLPAEQYAIQTGKHPALTTQENIKRYKEQLKNIGFSFDWDKEVQTSDPNYFKWTQWIFLKLFNSFFDEEQNKARPIDELDIPKNLSDQEKEAFINGHRLVYQDEIQVNWCPALGTVLANEEVTGGVSERGGHPVVRRPMRQWVMRITSYAERLISGLEELDWPESIKLSQKNWIGKSHGAEITFQEKNSKEPITVFTTRPDTIFGVTYLVLAPEHPLVDKISTSERKASIEAYIDEASKKSDLERAELDKTKTGVFTGAFAINPVSGEEIQIWVSDYVLISYGTGAVMAVPGGDQRDFEFAQKFNLEIRQVITPDGKEIEELNEAYPGQGIMLNSGAYNGWKSEDFFPKSIELIEAAGAGKATINYKLRDWVFNRQRYWGEPIPILHTEDGRVVAEDEENLPLTLPEVESYEPSESGESPLARIEEWVNIDHPKYGKVRRETNTMPQWAGSCWYYLRYLNPENENLFADPEAIKYWMPVDVYIGGAEHAVLHLLYSRFWHKVLFDLGYVSTDEPFQRLINQGMIQGRSNFVYRVKNTNTFVSHGLRKDHDSIPMHVDVNIVRNDELDLEAFRNWRSDLADAEFILEDGKYVCGVEVEKMSKSKYNVVNPDKIIEDYGADTLRMYEMFLGPLEQSKPWNTNGIDGVHKFLKKFWSLFFDEKGNLNLSDEEPSKEALKVVHKTFKKVQDDIERFSFNTPVSEFMICVNRLRELNCNNRDLLEKLVIALSPFAPHISEELWNKLGHSESVTKANFPQYEEKYLQEDVFEYPISINGKMRTKISFPVDMLQDDMKPEILSNEVVQKWLEGKEPKKVIIVPKRIVNVVV
ncbi:MAG: leucine--tRNA ligase [Bacteroidota bacterium]